jgi:hypothetical protein
MARTTRLLLLGTAIACAGSLWWMLLAATRRQHSESLLDDSLRDSFPASDPPATQDFDIPVNRQ